MMQNFVLAHFDTLLNHRSTLIPLQLKVPHHLQSLSSAQGLIGLPLGQVVFRSAVGSKLDGLLRGRLIGLLQLTELLVK